MAKHQAYKLPLILRTVFVLILFTHVSLFAQVPDSQDQVLQARLETIQFAADHFLAAINSYFWSLTMDREAGKTVDPYEYALARNYFHNNQRTAYRPHFITPRFKFIKDSEFKVINVEPERLAIRTPDGKILWNAEKLSALRDFSVFDAMKILLHEFNHSYTGVDLNTESPYPKRTSRVAEVLYQQKMLMPKLNSVARVDLSQKDKFVSNFVAFLQSRTLAAQDSTGQNQFSVLNLVLNQDQNQQVEVFETAKARHIYQEGLLGWSTSGQEEFFDETQKLQILYDTDGRTKLASKPVSEEVDGYIITLSRYSAEIKPEVQIQSITIEKNNSANTQVKINFTTLQQPIFVNDSSLNAFQYLDRQSLPNSNATKQDAKAIFVFTTNQDTATEDALAGSSLDLNYRSNLVAANFNLVKVVDHESERFFTFDMSGINIDTNGLKMPILVCQDSHNQKYTLTASQLVQKGKNLRAIFKTKYLGELTATEVVWPGYQSAQKTEYIEYVVRTQAKVSVPPHSNFNQSTQPLVRNFKVDDIRFDLNGQLNLKINGDENDLSRIDSLLVELGHFRNYKMTSLQVEKRNPYWTQQVGEKITIPANKFKKYIKSNMTTGLELQIPIQQLSQLFHNLETSQGLQISDSSARAVTGLWLKTKEGALMKIDLEKEALYEKESAARLKEMEELRAEEKKSPKSSGKSNFDHLVRKFLEETGGLPAELIRGFTCKELF